MNKAVLILSAACAVPSAFCQDGVSGGAPPPGTLTPTRHVAATSAVHDPRTSYSHLPVISGRPVNDTPIVMGTWSGSDMLTWHYPGATLGVVLSPLGVGDEDFGGAMGNSPVPPPSLPDGWWSLYEEAFPYSQYGNWLKDSAALLSMPAAGAALGADGDGDGQISSRERSLHLHPFDARANFAMEPIHIITPSDPPCVTMQFAGLSGRIYALEWTADVTAGGWQPVQDPFLTPDSHESAGDIGTDRYFLYAYTAELPPAAASAPRVFFRMASPIGVPYALAGSGTGASGAQFFIIPPPDEHMLDGSLIVGAPRLGGRFWNELPGITAGIAFNEDYIDGLASRPDGILSYRPVNLPAGFDLNDPLRVFDFVFDQLMQRGKLQTIYPTEGYLYWSLQLGKSRFIRGNINLSARDRNEGVLSFYYTELVDVLVDGALKRYQLVNGRRFQSPVVDVSRSSTNPLVYKVGRRGRTTEMKLYEPSQAAYPTSALRSGERFVERTMDESGLQFLLVYQPPAGGRGTGHFLWLLDTQASLPHYPAPKKSDFEPSPIPGTASVFRHKRTGFVFALDGVPGDSKRYVLLSVRNENVSANSWFDGPGDQLNDNFDRGSDPIRTLLLEALPSLPPLDPFGYITSSQGTERVGLYVYGGYSNDSELADFIGQVTERGTNEVITESLWTATVGAAPITGAVSNLSFDGQAPLPPDVTLTSVQRGTSGRISVQTSEPWETPMLPLVWMTKTQKGTVVRIEETPAAGPRIAGEYRTAPEVLTRTGSSGYPWRDGFGPGPTTVAVDHFGDCWVANTGDDQEINGIRMGSVTRISSLVGGTRCLKDGTPNAAGDYLKPPFTWISPTVQDRDGDGLIRTSRGLGDVRAWRGNTDAFRLDGKVTEALDELITNFVRVHERGAMGLACRDDLSLLWTGGAENEAWEPVQTVTGRGTGMPRRLTGGLAGLFDLQRQMWVMGKAGVARYRFDNTAPLLPVLQGIVPVQNGPAASRPGALGMTRIAGNAVLIGSSDPSITNELSFHSVSPSAFSRLKLTIGDNIDSRGVAGIAELSPGGELAGRIFATELPADSGLPPSSASMAGTVWITNSPTGNVSRVQIPANSDIPAPLNRGLTGVSQGRGRGLWFADFLGHRAIRTNLNGTLTTALNLYTSADLAAAREAAAATNSEDPYHRIAGPWTTGDMTGMHRQQRGNAGFVVILRDSLQPRHEWQNVTWSGDKLSPETTRVYARASDRKDVFTMPVREIGHGQNLTGKGFEGRWLQLYIRLNESPNGNPALAGIIAR